MCRGQSRTPVPTILGYPNILMRTSLNDVSFFVLIAEDFVCHSVDFVQSLHILGDVDGGVHVPESFGKCCKVFFDGGDVLRISAFPSAERAAHYLIGRFYHDRIFGGRGKQRDPGAVCIR